MQKPAMIQEQLSQEQLLTPNLSKESHMNPERAILNKKLIISRHDLTPTTAASSQKRMHRQSPTRETKQQENQIDEEFSQSSNKYEQNKLLSQKKIKLDTTFNIQ